MLKADWGSPTAVKRDIGSASILKDGRVVIKFVMEQRNLTVKDLVPYSGRPNRVYEVLNRKRPLTTAMAWKLHTGLGIPAESLLKQAA